MLNPLSSRSAQLNPLGFKTAFGGAATYQSTVLALANLQAYWPLTETSGTTAVDVKGSYNGTYNNCTLASQPGAGATMGSAPQFDGSISYVQQPYSTLNTLFNSQQGALAVWAYLNETWNNGNHRIAWTFGTDFQNSTQIFKDYSSQTATGFYEYNNISVGQSGTVITAGWHHFAIDWDVTGIGKLNFYIDGTVQGSGAAIASGYTGALTSDFCQIGARAGGGNWLGWLHHAALFSSTLTQGTITTLATPI